MKLKQKLMSLIRDFSFFGFSYMIADFQGRPKGIVWLVACTGFGNFRILPIGYRK